MTFENVSQVCYVYIPCQGNTADLDRDTDAVVYTGFFYFLFTNAYRYLYTMVYT
jgi:hypothetical protein